MKKMGHSKGKENRVLGGEGDIQKKKEKKKKKKKDTTTGNRKNSVTPPLTWNIKESILFNTPHLLSQRHLRSC
jgi:hypothetical protein